MAKRNQKNGQDGNRTTVWGISFFGMAAILAVIYLGLCNTCESLGRQIKHLEDEQTALHKQVVNEERNWTIACSIGNMERLMATHGITMTFPAQANIIRMQAIEPEEPAQYALQRGAAPRD